MAKMADSDSDIDSDSDKKETSPLYYHIGREAKKNNFFEPSLPFSPIFFCYLKMTHERMENSVFLHLF